MSGIQEETVELRGATMCAAESGHVYIVGRWVWLGNNRFWICKSAMGPFSELWSLVKDEAPVWVILWSLARRMFFSQQDTFESMTGALHHKQTTTDDNY